MYFLKVPKGKKRKNLTPSYLRFVSFNFVHLSLSFLLILLLSTPLESPQVSRTLLSILAIINNAVVWMVSTRPPTSKSSTPFSNPLLTYYLLL